MISLSYDLDAGALYIKVDGERGKVARTVEIDTGTLVDLDASGRIAGIEVIQPARSWPLDEILGRFSVGDDDERELRAYFAQPTQRRQPEHPAQGVRVAAFF